MATSGKPMGIKDVAAAAGVSIATVSNVLNGTKSVSPALVQRVMQAVDTLDYRANAIARGLKRGRTQSLCVIVPSIMSVFFPKLLHGMQQAASAHGYSLQIYETDQRLAQEQAILERLREQWIDGILLSTCANPQTDGDYLQALSRLSVNGRHIPVVCCESAPHPDLDAVVVDHFSAAKDAVAYLLGLGRTRIAHIAAPLRFAMGQARRDGYLAALQAANLPQQEARIAEGDYSPQSGYDRMCELLRGSHQPPDAVFCGNDQMAVGAIRAIQTHGLRIPDDIAVMGFDNNFPSTLISPALSSVAVPKQRMGRESVELLITRLEQLQQKETDRSTRIVVLETQRVIRQSTDFHADSDWDLEDW